MTNHHSHICQTEAVSFNSSVKRHTVTISQFTKEIITGQHLMTHQYDHQAISYDSPRGGVSQITEKGETTASFLLIQVIINKTR